MSVKSLASRLPAAHLPSVTSVPAAQLAGLRRARGNRLRQQSGVRTAVLAVRDAKAPLSQHSVDIDRHALSLLRSLRLECWNPGLVRLAPL
jgi:hypothetical protein